MISGIHTIIYSKDAEADRKFFKNILKLPNVDDGDGWLIFGLPPAEVAVHPHTKNNLQELYLMCNDIKAFVMKMAAQKIRCSAIDDRGYGLLIQLTLPGGGKLGVYEPRHKRPKQVR